MKIFLYMALFILHSTLVFSQEIEKIDIEIHPQASFPKITLSIGNESMEYYGSSFSGSGKIKYVKESKKLAGEVPLSGYIFAKEFVESFRIPGALKNQIPSSSFLKIFSENDASKIVNFVISVNDRKIIENNTAFATGYLEIKSPKNNDERYFIKLSDLNKNNVKILPDQTKINLLKSVTVYSFQNVLTGLNYGDIEAGSKEEKLANKLEQINLSLCGQNCTSAPVKDLGKFATDVGKIVSFEVVGHSKISNMDDFNKYILAQQWCLLKNFSGACASPSLSSQVDSLTTHPIILELIKRHKTSDGLCSFFKK